MDLDPRPIKSSIPVHNFKPEREKVSRWSFMKVLREHSDLKEYYPEVNPFVECYGFRPNTYAIFSPSIMAGCGDVWSYLIIGPEKALLIDTAFGLGDLRATCEHLRPGERSSAPTRTGMLTTLVATPASIPSTSTSSTRRACATRRRPITWQVFCSTTMADPPRQTSTRQTSFPSESTRSSGYPMGTCSTLVPHRFRREVRG